MQVGHMDTCFDGGHVLAVHYRPGSLQSSVHAAPQLSLHYAHTLADPWWFLQAQLAFCANACMRLPFLTCSTLCWLYNVHTLDDGWIGWVHFLCRHCTATSASTGTSRQFVNLTLWLTSERPNSTLLLM